MCAIFGSPHATMVEILYDANKEQWSTELLKLFKINKSLLPKVKENSFNFGVTKLFGGNIQIGGMAGDQQAATIGQACFSAGQSKSTYGTGCFLLMNIGSKFKISTNKLFYNSRAIFLIF